MGVAVVELGFGRDGDEVVVGAEEACARRGEEGGVGEDEGDGEVEEGEGREVFGAVVDWMVLV